MTFVFVSGDLALDFAATLKWRRTRPVELLATPADAARWSVEAGVLTTTPEAGQADLERLIGLREAVYRLTLGSLAGAPWLPADLALLNDAAAARPPRVVLSPAGTHRTGDPDAIAATIATAAADLLSSPSRTRVRECARDECTRLFVDRSRAGSRTWCGMDECGNRIKAASYRARRSALR